MDSSWRRTSSQTGASQAGILLGSNEDIPAFRWVEKERGLRMVCSTPPDCADIERRLKDARFELSQANKYTARVVNDDIGRVVRELNDLV